MARRDESRVATQRRPAAMLGVLLQGVAFLLVWTARVTRTVADWREPSTVPLLGVAAVLALGASVLTWMSIRSLGRQWAIQARTIEGHTLITSGPYRYVRHPIYVAGGGFLAAVGIAWSTWWAFALAAMLYAAGTLMRVRAEDALLAATFGESFAVYRSRVAAVIPGMLLACLLAFVAIGALHAQAPAGGLTVSRISQNPLITIHSSPTLGGNVNGATVIRVPDWVHHPLGRYYMYFANHMGRFIRLAYADAVTGPWTIYEPGVLDAHDTAFYRPQPDPPETLGDFYTHVASPEIYIDDRNQRIVMWTHGWWTNGERWPADPAAARRWANANRYGQFTQSSESKDGLAFDVKPAITRTSYLRVFRHDGMFYAMSRLGLLSRSADPYASFETGPNPFRGGPYANKLRHVTLVARRQTLYVFFTAIGDSPERVMLSTIDMSGDWNDWRASTPTEVLAPEAAYECASLPNVPSESGDVEVPVRQIRDPFVFEDDGHAWLFYAVCGEQGIAAAEITGL